MNLPLAALVIPILVIVVVGGILILIGYFLWKMLASKANLFSAYTATPPPTLSAPTRITYHCDVAIGRRPPAPLPGAEVVFAVSNNNATVDGASTKTVLTDAQGDASVTLAPVRTGSCSLLLHVQAGGRGGDETPIPFEVFVP